MFHKISSFSVGELKPLCSTVFSGTMWQALYCIVLLGKTTNLKSPSAAKATTLYTARPRCATTARTTRSEFVLLSYVHSGTSQYRLRTSTRARFVPVDICLLYCATVLPVLRTTVRTTQRCVADDAAPAGSEGPWTATSWPKSDGAWTPFRRPVHRSPSNCSSDRALPGLPPCF